LLPCRPLLVWPRRLHPIWVYLHFRVIIAGPLPLRLLPTLGFQPCQRPPRLHRVRRITASRYSPVRTITLLRAYRLFPSPNCPERTLSLSPKTPFQLLLTQD